MANRAYLVHYSMGFEYFVYEGKIKEALQEYKKVIRLKPDYSAAYYDIGLIYGILGKPGYALRYFRKYLKFHHSLSDTKEVGEIIKQLNKRKVIQIF